MDPPSYGRGPGGEVWKLEEQLFSLVELCRSILSPDAKFFLLNSYTTVSYTHLDGSPGCGTEAQRNPKSSEESGTPKRILTVFPIAKVFIRMAFTLSKKDASSGLIA